jgi:uncharacterized membrane protein YbhN (UPF0104 family)
MPFEIQLKKRHLALFAGSIAALLLLAAVPQLLGEVVADGIDGLSAASPAWLWVAALGFAGSLAAAACAWQFALTRCGGETSRADSAARYCTGSLVNAVAPARVGSAVRIGLLSRTLRGEGRLWTVGGVAASLAAVRALWLAVVLALGSASGVLPRWPIAVLLLGAVVAGVVAWRARDSRPGTRAAHVLDVFRILGRCPKAAVQLAGWVGLAMAAKIGAAAAVAAALGIERPLAAALLVIPALDLAGLLPLTPGNVGVSSAAVAFALTAHGAAGDVAVSAGIALGAVETLTTLACGSASLLYFAAQRADERRWQTALAASTACFALGAAFGATVLVPLV